MAGQQARSRIRMSRVPLAAAIAIAVVIAGVALVATLVGHHAADGGQSTAGHTTIAGSCPGTWTDTAVKATRSGRLVPGGARSALLCSYPEPGYKLAATRRITKGATNLIAYLNGLPSSPPTGEYCTLMATTAHVIVFEYADRQPAVAYARNCAWDHDGAVRYHGDIRKVTAYWSVSWKD